MVNRILQDGRGRLWIGSDTGIYSVKLDDLNRVADGKSIRLTSVTFDESDGMSDAETNGQKSYPAGCRDTGGRLWFPTVEGIAVNDPDKVDLLERRVPVVIESLWDNGRVVLRNDFEATTEGVEGLRDLPDESSDGAWGVLQLPSGTDVLEFRYTGISFTSPKTVEYRHRIVGIDDSWIECGDRQTAFYSNLPPGVFSFDVQARQRGGSWAGPVTSLAFIIEHRFYETFVFQAASIVAALVLAVSGYRWRVGELDRFRTLQGEKRLLEERTRILRDLHDGVGSGLADLHMLSELVDRNLSRPEVAGTHARELTLRAQEVSASLRELIWLSKAEPMPLDALVNRITGHGRRVLDTAGIRCREQIEPAPDLFLPAETARNLYFSVKEAVTNVFRHSGAAEVRLTFRIEGSEVVFTIHDDGEWCSAPVAVRGLDGGDGLGNMRSRVESIGGRFNIGKGVDRGTVCKFAVPLSLFSSRAL